MAAEKLSKQLSPFLPEDALPIIAEWIIEHRIHFTIARKRKSVFGDYHWPQNGKGHRISVNGDLNKYAFFITLVHEMAHLITWNKYRNTVSSHGKEWKTEFNLLMEQFRGKKIFPPSVKAAFKKHLLSPAFSHCVDEVLMKTLSSFDKIRPLYVDALAEGEQFYCEGRIFSRGAKLRKRIKCTDMKTRREYLFNPAAQVKRIRQSVN